MTPREVDKLLNKEINIYSMSEKDTEELYGIVKVFEIKLKTLISTRAFARDNHLPNGKSKD